jgi:hypothetical protein
MDTGVSRGSVWLMIAPYEHGVRSPVLKLLIVRLFLDKGKSCSAGLPTVGAAEIG